jgi:F0F1-type ATP synthase delta subunit
MRQATKLFSRQVRTYAKKAAAPKKAKFPTTGQEWAAVLTTPPKDAPTAASGNAGKYASFFLNASHNLGVVEEVRPEMAYLKGLFASESFLKNVSEGTGPAEAFVNDVNLLFKIENLPAGAAEAQEKKGAESYKKFLSSKPGLSKLTNSFLASTLAEGVVSDLSAIATNYEAQVAEFLKETNVEITTAEALTDKQRLSVMNTLKPHLKEGAKVQLSEKVDSSIFGGFTLQIGSKFVDVSLRRSYDSLDQQVSKEITG